MTSQAVTVQFNEDEEDAMREIVNVAMGQAGSSLATLMDTFVDLTIPNVKVVETREIATILNNLIGQDKEVIAVREAFYNDPRGEAFIVYDGVGWRNLAGNMGYDESSDFIDKELLLDLSNLLIGACLNGIADQIGAKLNFSAPSIFSEHIRINSLFDPQKLDWTHGLMLEICFLIKEKEFSCRLIILTPNDCIENIRGIINEMLNAL